MEISNIYWKYDQQTAQYRQGIVLDVVLLHFFVGHSCNSHFTILPKAQRQTFKHFFSKSMANIFMLFFSLYALKHPVILIDYMCVSLILCFYLFICMFLIFFYLFHI